MAANLAAGFAQDTGLYDLFLKEWYINKWADLLNNLTTTYKYLRRRVVNFKGRRMVIPLRIKRTGAVGAIQVSGYVAVGGTSSTSFGGQTTIDPGFQGVTNALVRPKIVMGAIGVPQDTIDISASDRGAFYEATDFEMMNMKTDMANFLDKQMFLGGRDLADITVVSTTTLTVTNTFPFHANQRLDFIRADGTDFGVLRGSETVLSVDRANDQIELEAAVASLAATDRPFTQGARSIVPTSQTADIGVAFEMLGLDEIISDTNLGLNNYEGNKLLFGIDRAAGTGTEEWRSIVNDLSDSIIDFDDMHTLSDEVHDNSGGDPTLIITSRPVRREVVKRMAYTYSASGGATRVSGTQRFQSTTSLKGGWIGRKEDTHGQGGSDWVLFDDHIPIVVDRYCPHNVIADTGTMYFLDTRHWYMGLVTDWKWWAPEGKILREAQGNAFGIQAHAYIFGELICDAPNTAGRIDGISINTAA